MIDLDFVAYSFLTPILDLKSYPDAEAYANSEDFRKIIQLDTAMYNVNTKRIMSYNFSRPDLMLKIDAETNLPSEIYRRETIKDKQDISWVAYTLDLKTPLAYYLYSADTPNQVKYENKYDYQTDNFLQQNICPVFPINEHPRNVLLKKLPKEMLILLDDFRYFDEIRIYAEKPYGKIVEFILPQQMLPRFNEKSLSNFLLEE